MTEVENTTTVLYHYLRALSVKVSRRTVSHLLDTPVGDSMRGISDTLDALHIKNEVYQLPPSIDYFTQLEAPFITMMQVDKNPFCIATYASRRQCRKTSSRNHTRSISARRMEQSHAITR